MAMSSIFSHVMPSGNWTPAGLPYLTRKAHIMERSALGRTPFSSLAMVFSPLKHPQASPMELGAWHSWKSSTMYRAKLESICRRSAFISASDTKSELMMPSVKDGTAISVGSSVSVKSSGIWKRRKLSMRMEPPEPEPKLTVRPRSMSLSVSTVKRSSLVVHLLGSDVWKGRERLSLPATR